MKVVSSLFEGDDRVEETVGVLKKYDEDEEVLFDELNCKFIVCKSILLV